MKELSIFLEGFYNNIGNDKNANINAINLDQTILKYINNIYKYKKNEVKIQKAKERGNLMSLLRHISDDILGKLKKLSRINPIEIVDKNNVSLIFIPDGDTYTGWKLFIFNDNKLDNSVWYGYNTGDRKNTEQIRDLITVGMNTAEESLIHILQCKAVMPFDDRLEEINKFLEK